MKIIVFLVTLIILSVLGGLILISVAPIFYDPWLYPVVVRDVFILQFVYISFSYSLLLIWMYFSSNFRSLGFVSHGLYCLAFVVFLYFALSSFAWGTNLRSFFLFMISTGIASYLIPKVHQALSNDWVNKRHNQKTNSGKHTDEEGN